MVTSDVEDLVTFCRALREHGLAVTPAEVVTAATSLRLIDASDREEVFLSLRSILTTRNDDYPIFEELFKMFWWRKNIVKQELSSKNISRASTFSPDRKARDLAFFLEHWASSRGTDTEPLNVRGASEIESGAEKDFGSFSHDELEQISRLARRIGQRLGRDTSRAGGAVTSGARAE